MSKPIIIEIIKLEKNTVLSEIFARVLFSRNFAYAKFREHKNLEKRRNPLCRLLIKVKQALVAIFNVANMSFNASAIRENKILAKIKFSRKFPALQ